MRTLPERQVWAIEARVVGAGAGADSGPPAARFTRSFVVGGSAACDLQVVHPAVAARHLQVIHDGLLWWARDLGTAAGTYLAGAPIRFAPLGARAELQLGRDGPRLSLTPAAETGAARARAPARTPPSTRRRARTRTSPGPGAEPGQRVPDSETRIAERYLRAPDAGPAGRETMIVRRAFARVQRRSSLRLWSLVAAVVVVLSGAGAVIARQARRLHALRATAEAVYYATRSYALQTAREEAAALARGEPRDAPELARRRGELRELEGQYESFVKELGLYAKLAPEDRVILRVARTFGECDLELPAGFSAEVKRAMERWRADGRLAKALARLRRKGYAPEIARALSESGLPRQYLFVALQESAFDERAVGPATRFGHAKGMWQFIAPTAYRYGLRIGPRYDEPVYDDADERFNWQSETRAAARYLRDLQVNETQGSGILAVASYNWGETHVRELTEKLPQDPRERNFWKLLSVEGVPRETYDYVLGVFSAAVICEDPGLFGFAGVDCPFGSEAAGGIDEAGRLRGPGAG